ncbi:MAG: DNA-3-methyladenine glycosylase I, partial [Venatoribacter sp.]
MSIDYQWLYDTVRKRFASDAAMEAYLPQAKSAQELAALGDDRYLSAMSQRVFQAGMTHSVVNNKWPNFEEAFWGFVPEKMVLLSPEQIDAYMKNDKIIRHRTKLQSIPQNAQ